MKHCVSGLKSPVSWAVQRAKVAKKCLENRARPCRREWGGLPSLCMKGKGPGGYSLGILGGGVLPGSLNPDPVADQKMLFSTPFFRPDL